MVVVVLPAGFGLREVVLPVLLTGPLSKSEAAAVVLLSRFIITGSDVVRPRRSAGCTTAATT